MKEAEREVISAIQMAKRDLERDLTDLERLIKASDANVLIIGSSEHSISVSSMTACGQIIRKAMQDLMQEKRDGVKLVSKRLTEQL